jgi:Mg2+-importing ATPase
LAFGVLWYVFRANIAARQSFFLSGWFVVGLLTQTLVVQMIRTRQAPFTQSRASYPVLATTGAVIFAGMLIPFSLVERQLGKVTLPPGFMGFAGLWALAYAATMQLVKRWYIARYHEWL